MEITNKKAGFDYTKPAFAYKILNFTTNFKKFITRARMPLKRFLIVKISFFIFNPSNF